VDGWYLMGARERLDPMKKGLIRGEKKKWRERAGVHRPSRCGKVYGEKKWELF